MSKVKVLFYGSGGESDDHHLELFATANNLIFIRIQMDSLPPSWIELDKDTAIKLSKSLKTEINKLAKEVSDGDL